MEQDLFSRLPPEIVTSILSRLSVRGVARSKCVCKTWLDLLCSDDFVNSYRSKSAALAMLTSKDDSNWCEIFDIDDLVGRDPIAEFDFPHSGRATVIGGSVNGLLLLQQCFVKADVDVSYVCNPITREFVAIHFHVDQGQLGQRQPVAYGFGASNVSGEYKLVQIGSVSGHCHVYTLGTRRWRRVEAAGPASSSSLGFGAGYNRYGAFLNGKIYWPVQVRESDPIYSSLVACFDLEKECLSTFAHPPCYRMHVELFTLKDCLSFLDVTGDAYSRIVIWVMKECGVEKSWTKEYVIDFPPYYFLVVLGFTPSDQPVGFEVLQGIKAFENGDILVFCEGRNFFRYSIKTKTCHLKITSLVGCRRRGVGHLTSLLFTPSFRSLKSLGMEDVITF